MRTYTSIYIYTHMTLHKHDNAHVHVHTPIHTRRTTHMTPHTQNNYVLQCARSHGIAPHISTHSSTHRFRITMCNHTPMRYTHRFHRNTRTRIASLVTDKQKIQHKRIHRAASTATPTFKHPFIHKYNHTHSQSLTENPVNLVCPYRWN